MATAILTGALQVLGVISDLTGIVSFGMDTFRPPPKVGSVLNVAVGVDYAGGLDNAGGDLPDVRLYNVAGSFLGQNLKTGRIKSGNTGEIKVNHNDNNGQQATYALFSANDDAICVAYVTITFPDGNKYAWTGDWGKACGGSWFYSNLFIDGSNNAPTCLWIDKNGDQPQTGFQVYFPDFVVGGDTTPETKSVEDICNAHPTFQMYTTPDPQGITYWVLPGQTTKRSTVPRSVHGPHRLDKIPRQESGEGYVNPHLNKLIISNSTMHHTEDLCNSSTSVGPDFVNLAEGDGMFCRMGDKTLWPVCTVDIVDNCFNLDIKELIVGGIAARDTPYIDVGDWTLSGRKA